MEFIDLQVFVAALAGAFLIALAMILRVLRSPGEGPGKPAGRVRKSLARQHFLPIAGHPPTVDSQPAGRRRGLDAMRTGAPAVRDDYYGQVEGKLEEAFEQFCRSRISLATYGSIVRAEEEAACRHISRLHRMKGGRQIDADTFEHELGIAELALQAIRWCINWSENQGHTTHQLPVSHDRHLAPAVR